MLVVFVFMVQRYIFFATWAQKNAAVRDKGVSCRVAVVSYRFAIGLAAGLSAQKDVRWRASGKFRHVAGSVWLNSGAGVEMLWIC